MNQDLRKFVHKVINKEKWWDILSRFIDVLRLNIFMVDAEGSIILPPEEGRFGGRLFMKSSIKSGWIPSPEFIHLFQKKGRFLELKNEFDFYCYALPIKIKKDHVIAYVVVGPVILNKRLDRSRYEEILQKKGINTEDFFNEISEIRVVSNIMMNSILDLLTEIIRDNVDLIIKEKENIFQKSDTDSASSEIDQVAHEIYSAIRLDELLATLLDVALKITSTECGSIMLIDQKKKELTIRVSRGLHHDRIDKTRNKLGEGISGLAAQDNTSFIIKGNTAENRLKPFLNRPDIRESLTMPLMDQNRVLGVLNLHTKKDYSNIEGSLNNLKHLSKLITSII